MTSNIILVLIIVCILYLLLGNYSEHFSQRACSKDRINEDIEDYQISQLNKTFRPN